MEDPARELLGQVTSRELEEDNLGPPPILKPGLDSFLEALTPMWGAGDRCNPQPEPSIKNYEVWLEWQACQANISDWWGELVAIPNAGDPERLAWKSYSSFKIPQVRNKALRGSNSYTVPPAPNASEGRCSCWSPVPIYLVRITASSNHLGPWLMPKPYSIG